MAIENQKAAMPLSSNLQRKFERLTPRHQAAVSAYRDALNTRADWIEAVVAAVEAADLTNENERLRGIIRELRAVHVSMGDLFVSTRDGIQ